MPRWWHRAGRWMLWSAPIVLLGWILQSNYLPRNTYAVSIAAEKVPRAVRAFAPEERYELIAREQDPNRGAAFRVITTDTVHLRIAVPRHYQRAAVQIAYYNPDEQPQVQIGVERGDTAEIQDVAVNENTLSHLPEKIWTKIQEGNLVLWQQNIAFRQQEEERDVALADVTKQSIAQLTELANALAVQQMTAEEFTEKRQALEQATAVQEQQIQTRYAQTEQSTSVPYARIADFFAQPPDPAVTRTYNYTLAPRAQLSGYTPSSRPTVLETGLRGPLDILTYVGKGETLSWTFTVQNINRFWYKDSLRLELWDMEKKLWEQEFGTTGKGQPSKRPSPEFPISIVRDNLPEGTYRLRLVVNDELLTKRIVTSQHLLMFAKSVYVVESPEYHSALRKDAYPPTTLVTNSSSISLVTDHDDGLQTVRVNNQDVTLKDLHVFSTVENLPERSTLFLPRNDVRINGNGYFAFAPEQLFLPRWEPYTAYTPGEDLRNIAFIIGNYPQPQQQGDVLVANAMFNGPVLQPGTKEAVFSLSFPGLKENQRMIGLDQVRVTFSEPETILTRLTRRKPQLTQKATAH